MKNLTKNLKFIFFIFHFSFFILLSCSTPHPQTNNILKLNLGAEPSYLNPILYTDSASAGVTGLVFNGLMKVDDNLKMIPDLASNYNISTDGKTYTFKLKQNVYWHDGKPFTAEDVIFTFNKIMDPKTNTVRRSNYFIDQKPIKFEKIDRYTIQAVLPTSFAPFLIHMGMGILPKHLLETEDINTTSFNRNPIGTGPFVFQEWQPAQYVKLKRNNNYYWKKPKLAGILLRIIPDKNTALISLKKGEIDLEDNIPVKDFPKIKKDKNLKTYRYYSMDYTYMGFNLRKKPFSKPKFRQAISYAINRKALVRAILKDFGKPAIMPASPVQWSYPKNAQITIIPYRPSKSKKILTELGYNFNQQTKLFEKNGNPLEFTIITNKGNKSREKAAQIIQKYLTNIGIKANLQLMEWSSFLKVIQGTMPGKSFDAYISGWYLGLDPDGYSLWHSSQYPRGFNYIGYNNKKIDKLLEAGRKEVNREKRKAIYQKFYEEITKDIPYYFLYHREILAAANQKVKGLVETPGPLGIIKDIEDVWLEE